MDSIDTAKLRQSILSDGVDDYFGLYEIIWGLNAKYPDMDGSEKLAVAIPVAADMLAQGLIELYASTWTPTSHRQMNAGEAAAAIRDLVSWMPPDERGGGYVAFAATKEGERLYFGSGG